MVEGITIRSKKQTPVLIFFDQTLKSEHLRIADNFDQTSRFHYSEVLL